MIKRLYTASKEAEYVKNVSRELTNYGYDDEASVTALMKLIEKKPDVLKDPRLMRKINNYQMNSIIKNDGVMIAVDGKPIKLNTNDIEKLMRMSDGTKNSKKYVKDLSNRITKSEKDVFTQDIRDREKRIDEIHANYKLARKNNELDRKYYLPYTPNVLQRVLNKVYPGADMLYPKTIGKVSKYIDKKRYAANKADKKMIGEYKRDSLNRINNENNNIYRNKPTPRVHRLIDTMIPSKAMIAKERNPIDKKYLEKIRREMLMEKGKRNAKEFGKYTAKEAEWYLDTNIKINRKKVENGMPI